MNIKTTSINVEERTAIVRYHSNILNEDVDVVVICHESGELDFENFESLSEEEFNEVCDYVTEDEVINNAFSDEVE
jgi:hypothetical protein